jgi:hypothetical protein
VLLGTSPGGISQMGITAKVMQLGVAGVQRDAGDDDRLSV